MSDYFTLRGGCIIAEIDLHSNGVCGLGRAEWPVLRFSLNLTLRAHEQLRCALDFRELRCRVSPFDQSYIAHSLPAHIGVFRRPGEELNNFVVELEVPIDQNRLASIERQRNGGDVPLRLDLELLVDEMVMLADKPNHPHNAARALLQQSRTMAQFKVVIPRSRWLEQILPGTGYGKVHMMELPVIPIESCASMKSAFDALKKAQSLEREGHYDEAVSNCRKALEPFCESVEKQDGKGGTKRVQKLKAAWQTRLAQRTYDWLDSSLVVMRQAGNEAAHMSSTNYGQLEAQMLLLVTSGLLAYAAKTMDQPSP